jgi:hypothetical protein
VGGLPGSALSMNSETLPKDLERKPLDGRILTWQVDENMQYNTSKGIL